MTRSGGEWKGETQPEAATLAREDNDSAHHFYGELSAGKVSLLSLRYNTTFVKVSHQFPLPTLVACLRERRVQWGRGLHPGEPHVDASGRGKSGGYAPGSASASLEQGQP